MADDGSVLTLEEAERKLNDILDKDLYVEETSPDSGKKKASIVWNIFKKVLYKKDKKYTGYIKCIKCKKLQPWTYAKGTSNLRKHKCLSEVEGLVQESVKVCHNEPLKDPPQSAKKRVLRSSALYCATDLASFQSVEGDGFVRLAQDLIDIGHKEGRVDARRLLPSRVSVSSHLEEIAGEIKEKFVPLVHASIAANACAATTDMWTQQNIKAHFIAVICHMSGDRRTAFTVPFEEGPATADNIWSEILLQFALLGVSEEEVKKIVFVTDRGANIVAALRNRVRRLNCTAHILNTVLTTGLGLKKYDIDFLNDETRPIVDEIKILLENMNESLPEKSSFPIVQAVKKGVTQPSYVPMLSAFVSRYKEISERLKKNSEDFMLPDRETVKALVQILTELEKPFKRHKSVDLAGSIWPDVLKVISHKDSDTPMVAGLKAQWRSQFEPLEYLFIHQSAKSLVSYSKSTSINRDIKTTLKQEMEVRWNTSLVMFESIYNNYDELTTTLTDKKGKEMLQNVPKKRLEQFIELLRPFQAESVKLQADKVPTLQHVCLSRVRLMDHCKARNEEDHLIKVLKNKILQEMDRVFICEMEHKLASFLWPSSRKLKMLTNSERQEVHNEVRKLCLAQDTLNQPTEDEDDPPSPKPKRAKLSDCYTRYLDSDDEDSELAVGEIDAYLIEPRGDDSDILGWWRERKNRFPRLAALAESILVIPATSASSEREFSEAGHIYREKRLCLKPSKTSDILFVNSNADLLDEPEASRGRRNPP